MNIKDGYNSKKVTFDMQDGLDDQIDKLTLMISKLTAQGNNQNSGYIKVNRKNNQENSGDRRTLFRGRGQYRQNYRGRP